MLASSIDLKSGSEVDEKNYVRDTAVGMVGISVAEDTVEAARECMQAPV